MSAEHHDPVLARLAAGADPFLGPHHLEAARRFEALARRAAMGQRVTMSYDPARVGGRGAGGGAPSDLPDGAMAGRRSLRRLAEAMPRDCWGVLLDVLVFGKGFGEIETERQWPRRAAKLVLRIGLDQLAAQYGLEAAGEGRERALVSGWLGERLPLTVPETQD
ncbi:DUF6456 domain-containing protein [Devosia albogilva]|uniref:DUF6456 domain-containing protein n=1 Tax=Devosia albogilva TaxID=429726 RepID=A0ABW5QMX6_9HYPH